jgi:NCS1 family nucleobase:cation symporter-1
MATGRGLSTCYNQYPRSHRRPANHTTTLLPLSELWRECFGAREEKRMTVEHHSHHLVGTEPVVEAVPAGLSPRLWNEDLAPAQERTWGVYSLFCMWMSDVHSIGGYTFAAGLFFLGLSGWWVLSALILGIVLVFLFMNLSGFAGQRLGVPYPVLARVSFGVFGANLPALLRAIIAIAWYGIQTWLASRSVVIIALQIWPELDRYTRNNILGESTLGWLAFLLMWALQLLLLRHGMETIRRFQDWAGPAVWVAMLALTFYILMKADWNISLDLSDERPQWGALHAFLAAISLVVAYFSTLLLNFCDFSRFAPSRRAVLIGNFWGLPINFIAFSVVSVLVTAGTLTVYGEYIFDPVEVVGRIDNVLVLLLGAVTFAVATLGINVVANFVSPAYDLANVAPKHIDFRRGGLISAIVALLITPWNLFNNPNIINYFLGGLGALLGPLFGVIMVDYFLLRRQRVDVTDLFREEGRYSYRAGWNPHAVTAFIIGSAPALVIALVKDLAFWAPFSWFVGAAISALAYYLIARDTVQRTMHGRTDFVPTG